jgi:signal transduction histidine kinase
MGRLANSIAHEINNPLEAVTNLLYLLKTTAVDPESVQYLQMASTELERVSRITKQTLAFNRETNQPIEVALPDLLDGLITLYWPQMNKKGITVKRKYSSPSTVSAYPGELRQVFSNILRNAMEAISGQGNITLHIYPSLDWKDTTRRGVRVSIVDDGTGIPEKIRQAIFEPFFTTKQLKGSGLGLWLSCGIVAKAQGRISLRSSVRQGRSGTCFSIFLPTKSASKSRKASRKRDAVA